MRIFRTTILLACFALKIGSFGALPLWMTVLGYAHSIYSKSTLRDGSLFCAETGLKKRTASAITKVSTRGCGDRRISPLNKVYLDKSASVVTDVYIDMVKYFDSRIQLSAICRRAVDDNMLVAFF